MPRSRLLSAARTRRLPIRTASCLPPCLALGLFAVALRALQLSQRTFYWDDFLILHRYRGASLWELFIPHDGHVMPGSIALQVAADRIAPLHFLVPAAVIIAGTAIGLCTLYFVLQTWFPRHPQVAIVSFASMSLSPFMMDAAGWWSSALNIGSWWLAFVAGLAVLGRLQHSCETITLGKTSALLTGILLCGLLMSELSLSLLPAWLFVSWLRGGEIWEALRRWTLWIAPFSLWLAWGYLLLRLTAPDDSVSSSAMWPYVPSALAHTVVPGVLGGPWQWSRWAPSHAFSAPAQALWIIALAVLVALTAWWLAGNWRRSLALATILAGLAVVVLLFGRTRSAEGTVEMALNSPHYYAAWWMVSAFIVAVATARFPASRRHPAALAPIATSIVAVSSVASTLTWVGAWADDPTRDYVANLRVSLSEHPEPMLEQDAPLEILTPLAHPDDRVSTLTGRAPVSWTEHPLVVDPTGHIAPAGVIAAARSGQGSVAQCGYRMRSGESAMVPVTPALPFGRWVWELNAVASEPGTTLRITTPNGFETDAQVDGRAVTVPLSTQPATRWVRLEGGGGFLRVEVDGLNDNATVCLGSGALGPLVPQKPGQ